MVIGVDPGYEQSGIVHYRPADGRVEQSDTIANDRLLEWFELHPGFDVIDAIVFEQIESYGMAVGREVFETVFWTGRFCETIRRNGGRWERLPRKAVKLHLCESARANDSNIRQALKDLHGGSAAVGTKKQPGPLFHVKGHEWAALAVAVTWAHTKG